ncbi:MAG: hypothetical protein JSS83_28720 [Cyanobacteria bacterium SZAS LIN-3]|nr:hypothetical protein [Cyanobacteria bacterium SZAS LIN-3]
MKTKSRFAGVFTGFLLVVAALAGLVWLGLNTWTTWPHFPSDPPAAGQPATAEQLAAAASPAPEVIVTVDRDYAYRIGDIIPVTVYFKEKPGTVIDLHSIAIEGDFEIAQQPEFFERRTRDGARLVRGNIKLQSFSNTPKLTLKANLSYRIIATNEDVTVSLPAFEAYTSNTWDGRDIIQEGHLRNKYGLDPYFTAALVLGGIFGVVFFFRLARRYALEQPILFELKGLPSRFQLARRDFNDIWARMEAGDRSADRYVEVAQLVRRLYRVETKTTLEASYYLLYSYNGPLQVTDILRACDRVIYRHEMLSDDEHDEIKRVFDKLVPQYPAHVLAKLPPTRVAMRSAEATLSGTSYLD